MELPPSLEKEAEAVRALLAEGLARLARVGAATAPLEQALADLEGPFLLVVAGEFNSGKSSLLNALLGEPLLPEGVTPTTDRITLLAYGEEGEEPLGEDALVLRRRRELLRTLRFVDTPGTNAVIARHQLLTERFLPRADLILFVTSADRPYTESERRFLELIRAWGKKLALVVNKADLLDEAGRREVRAFVEEKVRETLGMTPPIFLVSARTGLGVAALEAYIRDLLAGPAAAIKLGAPLGVLLRLTAEARDRLGARERELAAELERCRTLDALLERHLRQTREEFAGRLAELGQAFRQIEARGERWFRETVRLGRILDLLNASKVERSFQAEVLADAESALTLALADAVRWLGRRERDLLASALDLLQATGSPGPEEEGLKEELRAALSAFSPEAEAAWVQAQVEAALRTTALAEAGAVGLGALVALLLHGLAADVTGLAAGFAAAVLGLSVLPRRREAALGKFRERLRAIEAELGGALEAALEEELKRSAERYRALYRPGCARAEAERSRLAEERAALEAIENRARTLRARLESADPTSGRT